VRRLAHKTQRNFLVENIKRHSNSPPKRDKRSNSKSPSPDRDNRDTANDISKDDRFKKTGLGSLNDLQKR